jgi:stringent starvation protein B
MLTKAQKESRVIKLYEQNKNYRGIAQQVHMPLSDISSIIKRHTGEDVQQNRANGEQQRQQKTKDTKALELFESGRTPVQATIELDYKSDDVTRLY